MSFSGPPPGGQPPGGAATSAAHWGPFGAAAAAVPRWAPPGWYPDPWRIGPLRWWDGWAWVPWPVPWEPMRDPLEEIAAARRSTQRCERWAQFAVPVFCMCIVGLAVSELAVAQSSPFFTSSTAVGPVDGGQLLWFNLLGGVVQLLGLAAFITIALWQYHAATTAQRLGALGGYRSRFSPSVGVVLWLVPFVDFVVPAMAIRDCLPAGHRGRRWVVIGAVTGGAGAVSAYIGEIVGGFLRMNLTDNGFAVSRAVPSGSVIAVIAGSVLLAIASVCGVVTIRAIRDRHAKDVAIATAGRASEAAVAPNAADQPWGG